MQPLTSEELESMFLSYLHGTAKIQTSSIPYATPQMNLVGSSFKGRKSYQSRSTSAMETIVSIMGNVCETVLRSFQMQEKPIRLSRIALGLKSIPQPFSEKITPDFRSSNRSMTQTLCFSSGAPLLPRHKVELRSWG